MLTRRRLLILLTPLIFFIVLVSCLGLPPQVQRWSPTGDASLITGGQSVAEQPVGQSTAVGRPTRDPSLPLFTPTPDAPRTLPTIRAETEEYTVQSGDFLARIAQSFNVSLESLIDANQISNPNLLEPGQRLIIPAPVPLAPGPAFKIVPDSELVRGPGSAGFNVDDYVRAQNGFLSQYGEEVDGSYLTAGKIVNRVAVEYSVNPRLLLALVEYQTGWVTGGVQGSQDEDNPLALTQSWPRGLYNQLSWAANYLNYGYYLWQLNRVSHYLLLDGSIVPPDSTINPGTAAIQYLFGLIQEEEAWRQAVSPSGIYSTYDALFGFPFDYAVEPVVPDGLSQPVMQLPFEPDLVWYFSGGPHGGWGGGSGWAALDFAPPGQAGTCNMSEEWAVAVADGVVTYSDAGTVLLDLDGDGFDQTGWVVLYLHIDSSGRVAAGTRLSAGDRIGHPSCEGGVSAATHVHLARRYNGEWIAADRDLPFNLDGWISQSTGSEYNGILIRDGQVVTAWDHRTDENRISR